MPHRRQPLPPILIDAPLVEFFIPTGIARCPSRFPECPTIQCQRKKHNVVGGGACNATGRDPYFSVFWENTVGSFEER